MRFKKFVGLKYEEDIDREARAQAAAEDRTLSDYLRRIIRDEVRRRAKASASTAPSNDRQEQAHV